VKSLTLIILKIMISSHTEDISLDEWNEFIEDILLQYNLYDYLIKDGTEINCDIADNLIDIRFLENMKLLKETKLSSDIELYTKLYVIISNTDEFEKFVIKRVLKNNLFNNSDLENKISKVIDETVAKSRVVKSGIINEALLTEISEYNILRDSISLTEEDFKTIFLIHMISLQDEKKMIEEISKKYPTKGEAIYEEFMRKKGIYILKYKYTFNDVMTNFQRELSSEYN
jgi:hypothetical protein